MKKTIFFTIILLIASFSFSQVGIGTETPEARTLLHVTQEGHKDAGVLLAPMSKENREDYLKNPGVSGLIIYNTTENCLNYYNGTKWKSLCGEVDPAVVVVRDGEAFGDYFEKRPTTDNEYILLPITVTEAGSINITITTDNGYSYTYSSPLIDTGDHVIKLPASGTPKNAAEAPNEDQGKVTVNGIEETETIPITVKPSGASKNYTVSCSASDVTVSGSYSQGIPLGGGNTITLTITSNETSREVVYDVFTDTQGGISFSAKGTIPAGTTTKEIILVGTGTPSAGEKTFTITSDSDAATASIPNPCTAVDITVQARVIRIFTNAGSAFGYSSGHWKYVFLGKTSFGPAGIVKVAGISVKNMNTNNHLDVETELNNFQPDILHLGYDYFGPVAVTMYNYARLHNVPIIVGMEKGSQEFLDYVYPDTFTVSGAIAGNFKLNAAPTGDPLTEGPFSSGGKITELTVHAAGSKWLNYTTLPSTVTPYMTNGSAVGIFRDESKGLIFTPNAGQVGTATATFGGVITNASGQFYANALAWAIDYLSKRP